MRNLSRRQRPATSAPADLPSTLAALQRQAEALAELQRRCALLRDARERSPQQLDAVTARIDAQIEACLLIAEQAALADPAGAWKSAATELERQLRRLAVLRSQVLPLYVPAPGARRVS